MKTLEKIELVAGVFAIAYSVLAFGLTTLNVFVEMPMVGPMMLLAAPVVLIVEYLVYIVVVCFVIETEEKEGR